MTNIQMLNFSSRWLALLAVIAAAYSLGATVLHTSALFSHPETATPAAPSLIPSAQVPGARDIGHLHWFGVAPGDDEISGPGILSVEDNFILKGISIAKKPNISGAFIAKKGQAEQSEQWYRVGDELPEGAGTLSAVYPDHVVVSDQSLAFPALPAPDQPGDTAHTSPPPAANTEGNSVVTYLPTAKLIDNENNNPAAEIVNKSIPAP